MHGCQSGCAEQVDAGELARRGVTHTDPLLRNDHFPNFIDFKVLEIPSPSAGGTVWISRPAVPALPPTCEQADIPPRQTSAHHPETAMPSVGLEGMSLLASGAAEVDLPRCAGPSAWCGSWCEMNQNYASGGPWCDAWRTIAAGSRPMGRDRSFLNRVSQVRILPGAPALNS
jgi:hypothetical protein